MKSIAILVVWSVALGVNASSHGSRIMGGHDAPEGKYPYQVSLWKLGNEYWCGGSIINERYILTAAHCLIGLKNHEMTVGIGSQSLNGTTNFINAEKLVPHKDYHWKAHINDIGLVRLAQKIVYTDKVQPITLTTEDFTQENYPVFVSGWGKFYYNGPSPDNLQEIQLKILPHEICATKLPVFSKQLCTFTKEGEGLCQADSGSPLVVDGVQIGIASYAYPCGRGMPDAYARVYSYLDWIAEHIEQY